MRILIIDDDSAFLNKFDMMVKTSFREIISNVSVDVVGSGFENELCVENYDMFLIDIHLDDASTNGLKIASRIRQMSEDKEIVFVSNKKLG